MNFILTFLAALDNRFDKEKMKLARSFYDRQPKKSVETVRHYFSLK